MKTKKAIFFLFVFLSYIPVLAQVDTAWVRRYDGPGNYSDQAKSLAVDNSGNVYVTGSSYDVATKWDYLTIKYAPNGDTLWVRRYNGPGNDYDLVRAFSVDKNGNVYITGSSFDTESYTEYATIKYAPNGDTLWVRRYNAGRGAVPYALAVDDSGQIYVSGSEGLIKYLPNGDTSWHRPYFLYGLLIDPIGNIYGNSGSSIFKLTSNGDTLWVRSLPLSTFTSLAIDSSLNVYVAGFSLGVTQEDYITVKFAPNGDTMWTKLYNGPGNQVDIASNVIPDEMGYVYVTGHSWGEGPHDYATIKYTLNGDTVWVRRYNGPENDWDLPSALAIDSNGNIYVTGRVDATFNQIGPIIGGDYATIKYGPNGDTLWIRRYDGPGNGGDNPTALAIDGSGNVYVTGWSEGSETSLDYATIKYVQFECIAKSGDANSDNNILLSDIVTIINFLFKSQPAPNPSCRADANADGNVLLSDIVYLINFLFKSGPVPQKSRECCL